VATRLLPPPEARFTSEFALAVKVEKAIADIEFGGIGIENEAWQE